MKVYKYNHVFDHIEITLNELFQHNKKFDDVVFVLGYNVLKNLDKIRETYPDFRIAIYQLEQLYDGSYWVNKQSYNNIKSADIVFDYDKENIAWMREHYGINAHYLPLLYTDALKRIIQVPKEIDVLYYGYTQERRARMFFNLQEKMAGRCKFINAYGIWGTELDSYIAKSKIILNIHSDDIARQEQTRIYYPVINNCCVLSEMSHINHFSDSIVQVPYGKMVDSVFNLLKNDNWKTIALNSGRKYKKISDNIKNKLIY